MKHKIYPSDIKYGCIFLIVIIIASNVVAAIGIYIALGILAALLIVYVVYLIAQRFDVRRKRPEIPSRTLNQRIEKVVEGIYDGQPAYQVTMEDGRQGYFTKEHFEQEVASWTEDTDDTVLLPARYSLNGSWAMVIPGI